MTSTRQRAAASRNIKKAAVAAKRKRTVAHLPKRTRRAVGREGAKVARSKRLRLRRQGLKRSSRRIRS